MNAVASAAGPTEASICQKYLDELVHTHTQINGAIVSTVDGFEVAARVAGSLSAAKLSAMTSSLLALAEAISAESDAGECRDMVIDASAGRILLMDIPNADRRLLLTVLCDSGTTLGQALWAARECREEIARNLGNGQRSM
jgi:uncharacterized protein